MPILNCDTQSADRVSTDDVTIASMKRTTLFEANPGLHNPERLYEYLVRTVATSSAIETGESVEAIAKRLWRFLEEGMPAINSRRDRQSE